MSALQRVSSYSSFDTMLASDSSKLMEEVVRRGRSVAEIVREEIERVQEEKPAPHTFINPDPLREIFLRNIQIGLAPSVSSGSADNGSVGEEAKSLAEQILLRKIGKVGDMPSRTGLNLHDAKLIDEFVNKNCEAWRRVFSQIQEGRVDCSSHRIKIKKTQLNGLPRSLDIGLELDLDKSPKRDKNGQLIMRVMVLCKKKISATEHPSCTADPLRLRVLKVGPIGIGTYKTVKAAFDWLTGDEFVQILMLDTPKTPGEAYAGMRRELHFMQIMSDLPGICSAGFLYAKHIKFTTAEKPLEGAYYYMRRYECDLIAFLEKEGHESNFTKILSYVSCLADALQTLQFAEVIHCDGKLNNTLVDKNGALVAMDFGLSMKKREYLDLAQRNQLCDGTYNFLAPEIVNAYGFNKVTFEVVNFPYARDMWAYGLQALSLFCIGRNDLQAIVYQFECAMNCVRLQVNEVWALFELQYLPIDLRYKAAIAGAQVKLSELRVKEKHFFFLDHELLLQSIKKGVCVYDYVALDATIDHLFTLLLNGVVAGMNASDAAKFRSLAQIIRMMMRADPNVRITPPALKAALATLSAV